MTKNEMLRALAQKTGFTKVDVTKVIDALEEIMIEQFRQHEEVKLFKGFAFEGFLTEPTQRRNPQTGEKIMVPPHTKVKLKVGKYIKEAINE